MKNLMLLIIICSFSTFQSFATNNPNSNKVVLISGATGGIGKSAVLAFQKQGWTVWAGYNKSQIPQDLQKLKGVHFYPLDVTQDAAVEKMVKTVIQQAGKIDVLVNNAGYALAGAEECVSQQQVEHLFNVNFYGALRLIQQVAPYMKAQNQGHILNISSTSGLRAVPGLGLYAASKFALEGLSESLSVTLSPWHIQVVLVEPGVVNNEFANHYVMGNRPCESQPYKTLAAKLPGKFQQLSKQAQGPDEIAALLVQIAENPNPDLRYQTSEKAKELAAKKLVDLTGNKMRDEQLKFFNALLSE